MGDVSMGSEQVNLACYAICRVSQISDPKPEGHRFKSYPVLDLAISHQLVSSD
jgi:hypothetical protein